MAHRRPWRVLNLLATGGLYSTPADLSRFGAMLLGGGTLDGVRVLSRDAVAEMTRIPTTGSLQPVIDDAWLYGLGLDTVRQAGLDAVGQRGWYKGGDTNPYHSALLLAPDADLGVAVLSAGRMSSAPAETLAERVLLRALVERHTLRAMPRPITAAALPATVATTPAHPTIDGIYLTSDAALRVQSGADGLATMSRSWTARGSTLQTASSCTRMAGTGAVQAGSRACPWSARGVGTTSWRATPTGPATCGRTAWWPSVSSPWGRSRRLGGPRGPRLGAGRRDLDLDRLVRPRGPPRRCAGSGGPRARGGGDETTFVDGSADDDLGSSFLVIPGLTDVISPTWPWSTAPTETGCGWAPPCSDPSTASPPSRPAGTS